jgi:hypothetical protein
MHARRVAPAELAALPADGLAGAVLLAPVRLASGSLAKGLRLDAGNAAALRAAAQDGALHDDVRLGWPDPDDLHEDDAAGQLARAALGPGLVADAARQSRVDLRSVWPGVLHVRTAALAAVNAIDPLELFTLFHGQAVEADQVVASVKVAPHVVPAAAVERGVAVARGAAPLLEVRPYRPLEVAAIVAEPMRDEAMRRFEAGAGGKVAALGGTFVGATRLPDGPPEAAEAAAHAALQARAVQRGVPVLLVGGVSAGDPLAPFFAALERLRGRVLRHGVPAHPGSMIWLGALRKTQILGLPQCGMFSLATAADLILPRLLTGERLDARALADLGHGGLLGREMRFRFPPYARELDSPETP